MDKSKLFDEIATSKVFLALGTKDFLNGLRDDNSDPTEQVKMAKALRKPVLLMFDNRLESQERGELRGFFRDFKVVREIEFDYDNPEGTPGKLKEIITEMVRGDKESV